MVKIGIIGGSGLDDPKLLSDYQERDVETEFGQPSSRITCGKIKGAEVYILARHGKNHDIPPHRVNYRANIAAFRNLGCDYIIATSAVGSLKEEIAPGDLVFPDQFIDFTKSRKLSFYDEIGKVVHMPMAEPFSKELRKLLIETAEEMGFKKHDRATLVVIEGPRFSTKAESYMFRQLGCDIIGMTAVPECSLANEAGIPYQTIAMSTDYDCWKEGEESVTFEMVLERMRDNSEKVKKLLVRGIEKLVNSDEDFIKSRIRTIPDFPKPGIQFRDITTLIKDREGFERTMNVLYNRYNCKGIDVVAGIESRGFIIGSILANKLGVGFVPIRKKGKLPYEVEREEYDLEYGKDAIEIHRDAINPNDRVLIVDDLIATGGTARAAGNLIQKLGGRVEEFAFVVELEDLNGRKLLNDSGHNVFSVVKYKESG